ncbi:hypothetical protein U14_04440 [Candidatus Moduliflexus flocculans]|uniref:Uncharacterized protein n=1 Tax=Candidatus Moduliflexus flocculans TaxID=1499966 RepID=A0A0S6W4A1_9BACT|nr:hypothetical protein U14_04440 [Candidatus Moduliflexus flocculans]
MNDTDYISSAEDILETEEQQIMSRRDYLLSLKKWSKVVIGGVLFGGIMAGISDNAAAGGWANRRGGWGNGGGGSWGNSRGGWGNGGGGSWRNYGGGSWGNGGGWHNGSSWGNGGWGNGGSWINSW